MKDRLAEEVLARVMGWDPGQVAAAGPKLQMLAAHKYDAYEGYKPGVKFLENLSVWLEQFDPDARRRVLRFVLEELVFVSRAELDHLIETVYPDVIRPMVIREAAERIGTSPFAIEHVVASSAFKGIQRKLLLLGLSDGARLDRLRRSSPGLSHEQIYPSFDVGDETINEALSSLRDALQEDRAEFEHVLLVDDFYGSGATLLRDNANPPPRLKGRVLRAQDKFEKWRTNGVLSSQYRVSLIIYIMSSTAAVHVAEMLKRAGLDWQLKPILRLPDMIRITDPEITKLCDWHYDDILIDRHKPERAPLGFGDAGLPLVLFHNAPNNSICILWADTSDREKSTTKRRALFPRYERHREDRA